MSGIVRRLLRFDRRRFGKRRRAVLGALQIRGGARLLGGSIGPGGGLFGIARSLRRGTRRRRRPLGLLGGALAGAVGNRRRRFGDNLGLRRRRLRGFGRRQRKGREILGIIRLGQRRYGVVVGFRKLGGGLGKGRQFRVRLRLGGPGEGFRKLFFRGVRRLRRRIRGLGLGGCLRRRLLGRVQFRQGDAFIPCVRRFIGFIGLDLEGVQPGFCRV